MESGRSSRGVECRLHGFLVIQVDARTHPARAPRKGLALLAEILFACERYGDELRDQLPEGLAFALLQPLELAEN